MGFWFFICLSGIGGIAFLHTLPQLPDLNSLFVSQLLCLFAVIVCLYRSRYVSLRKKLACVFIGLLVFLLMMSYGTWRAQERLADRLSLQHDDRVSRLVVEVSDLVDYGDDYLQFDARVIRSKPSTGIPSNIRLRWSFGAFAGPYTKPLPLKEPMPEIKPGEIWELSALLRQPYGAFNPGQGDILSYRFVNNHRAVGTVKGSPKRLTESGRFDWSIKIAQLRHHIRAKLSHYVADKRYGSVMIALVMGDQAAISQDDWVLFNRSGLTHLVSISGSHITMLSSLASLLCFLSWRHLSVAQKSLSERMAAQRLAAFVGILVAWFYCSIAGWGVPAQRSFLMLLIFFINYAFALQWSIHMVLAVAALLVLLIEPWAVLSIGFWLSFGAMLVLILLAKEVLKAQGLKQKLLVAIRGWTKMQLAVFLGLAPLLALLFSQVSLISPITNAYAIFLIGTIITPASLLLAVTSQFEPLDLVSESLATITHYLLFLCLELTAKLITWSYALLDVPRLSMGIAVLALFSILSLFVARFSRWTSLSLLWLLPIFMGAGFKQTVHSGEWQAYMLDVGQGSAILIKTHKHHLLFDVGPRTSYDNEASNKVIIPVLRGLGIKHLDYVVVSHSDLDHVGGFSELISQVSVGHVYGSFSLDQWLAKEEMIFAKDYRPLNADLHAEVCLAGHHFELDGVSFSFIWPVQQGVLPLKAKSANEESCVLLVQGEHHNLLLTGDIDRLIEEKLIKSGILPKIDAVVVPHHGSKTSSSVAFIEHIKAQVAVAQAGHYNRYKHPDPTVVARWSVGDSNFYNTITDGAVTLRSSALGLQSRTERSDRKRYWH